MAVRRRTVVLGERKAASSCRLQSGRLAGEPGGIETLLSNEGSAEPKGKHPPILIAKLSAVHAGGELAGKSGHLATGERLGQAGWLNPSKAEPQGKVAEAEFTSSSGGFREPSVNAKKELSGEERTRNRSQPGQVA